MTMDNGKDTFERRLEELSGQWRAQRYPGPVPDFGPAPARPLLPWAAAFATAVIVALLVWPDSEPWPDDLRPVLRGSPLQASAPTPPPGGVGFRLPVKPSRTSCFTHPPSQTDACDQPAG